MISQAATAAACFLARIACEVVRGVIMARLRRRCAAAATRRAPGYVRALGEAHPGTQRRRCSHANWEQARQNRLLKVSTSTAKACVGVGIKREGEDAACEARAALARRHERMR